MVSPLPSSLPSMDMVSSDIAVCQAPSTVETSLGLPSILRISST
ncbi:Uncharacterised protein [Mycobacteroides abscessus subsp. abscessus]|nr:Uncharacterised protein [Mycobacteroides abscessus subsp. abscessus]